MPYRCVVPCHGRFWPLPKRERTGHFGLDLFERVPYTLCDLVSFRFRIELITF